MTQRNSRRDKLGMCSSCGFHKCPPGAKGNVCPDCLFNKGLEQALEKLNQKDYDHLNDTFLGGLDDEQS
jgi:hypothetical protein